MTTPTISSRWPFMITTYTLRQLMGQCMSGVQTLKLLPHLMPTPAKES